MKKRIVSILLTLCMVLCLMPTAVFAEGTPTGSENDPILIATAKELEEFRDRVNSGETTLCAKLTADIVLNDGTFDEDGNYTSGASGKNAEQWTPIGWYKSSNNQGAYAGTFDGGGYTIKGLYINSDDYNIGLFGQVKDATIQNLTVTGYVKGRGSVGGIVGEAYGSSEILNCVNYSNVTGDGSSVGGIVGNGRITTIRSCANCGNVTGGSDHVGGIVGYCENGIIENCANLGGVNGSNDYTGGIVGYVVISTKMTACYNVGTVVGTRYTGSLVGYAGWNNESGNDVSVLTANNCYYLNTAATKAFGKAEHFKGDTTKWGKSVAEFADGTVLKLLKQADADAWQNECGYLAAAGMTLPLLSWQTADDVHSHDGEGAMTATATLPQLPGRYYLTEDVTLYAPWEIDTVAEPVEPIVLCLNGHKIEADGDFEAICVSAGASLTLCDCKNSGSVTHKEGSTGMGVVMCGGEFTLNGGAISGNQGNEGAGVCIQTGFFIMNGGSICDNSSSVGAGVYVCMDGTFKMYGGSITRNKVTAGCGAGVYADGDFIMTGGSISGNEVHDDADSSNFDRLFSAGVYAKHGVTVSGSAQIRDNVGRDLAGQLSIDQSNLYLANNQLITIDRTMSNASIGVRTKDDKSTGAISHPYDYKYAEYFFLDSGNNRSIIDVTDSTTGKQTLVMHTHSADKGICTNGIFCGECGYPMIAATSEHNWSAWEHKNTTHTHKCLNDYCTAVETKRCTGGTATCTEQATCEVCSEKYGTANPSNHSGVLEWTRTATTHRQEWNCCHVETVTEENHNWSDGVCTECGYPCLHSDGNRNHKCDLCGKELSTCADNNADHKCDLCGKALSEHSGGTATCKDKAVCTVCGESYGKLDANNHTDLKHFPAVAATKTAEGSIEYWYCSGCDKYFADKDGAKEITKADTVTAKLPEEKPTSPKTGDASNLALWIALLFISGGAVIGTAGKRKKHFMK